MCVPTEARVGVGFTGGYELCKNKKLLIAELPLQSQE